MPRRREQTLTSKDKLPQWRRDEIKEVVLKVLNATNSDSLPIILNAITKHFNIGNMSKEQAVKQGYDALSIENAKAVAIENRYVIIYDPTKYKLHIRWSFAHEIGHAKCQGQLKKVQKGALNFVQKRRIK